MQVSKLDEIYSLSSTLTCKEMTEKITDYAKQSQIENTEPSMTAYLYNYAMLNVICRVESSQPFNYHD